MLILDPGISAGPVTVSSSHKSLIETLGHENVQKGMVPLGEGEEQSGTILFPNDPKKRLYILWRDNRDYTAPHYLIIYDKTSLWRTKEGIGMGTSLKTLEKLNGASFELYGFEWDYAGLVTNAKNGKLAYLGKNFTVSFEADPSEKNVSGKVYMQVCGDQQLSSDNQILQELDPTVYQINMVFN